MPVTMLCLVCGHDFPSSGRRRFCSNACKQLDWRRRHTTPAPIPTHTPPEAVVYECTACETRYLGERRCPDCNLFTRRIGPGGPCPHCDEPVAHQDLTTHP